MIRNSSELALQIVEYFRNAETFTAPLSYHSGVTKGDKDSVFRSISRRVLEGIHAEIDFPVLVRWMQHSVVRTWLKAFLTGSVDQSRFGFTTNGRISHRGSWKHS